MDRKKPIIVIASLVCAQGLHAQEAEVLHYEHVSDLRVDDAAHAIAALRTAAPTRDATRGGSIAMDFIAFGERFELELEPNARVNAAVRRAPGGATAYTGRLRDHPESWARVVLGSTGPSGLIWDGATLYGVEAPNDSLVDADASTIFRLDDVYVPPGTLACGAGSAPMSGMQMLATLVTEATALAAEGALLNLDIGTVADFEFSEAKADPSTAILTRINNVDGIFSEQVGVQITVEEIQVFTEADDPFTASDASDLLMELATYRNATPAQNTLGLTHLFTGRDLADTTVGVAYFGALCSRNFGAGLTESRVLGAALESLIAAHEIGHNFGAPHDGEDECATTPETFLMAPTLNGSNQFSDCSIEQMQAEIAAASCLTTIDFVDVALAPIPLAADPLTEQEFTYTVAATNLGAADSAGVTLELSFDPELEVVSITPAAGGCGPAQSNVTCDLGTLPGSTSRNITARLRSASAGTRSISGSLTATDDIAVSNDSFDDTIDVVAAADLSVSVDALGIVRGRSGNLNVTLRNLSGITAQSVQLTASVSAGLGIDSATLGGQACVVDASVVTCNAASLDGLTSAAIVLGLSGLVTGVQTVDLAVTALEVDPNPGDNSLPVEVAVTEPPAPAQQDGGGGSTGPFGLLSLLGLAAWLRRKGTGRAAVV